jgi:hypothetical protein
MAISYTDFPQRINVKEYGATGDGTTDDTSAVNAAIVQAQAQDKPLYFPTGNYKLTSWSQQTLTADITMFGDGYNQSIITGKDTSTAGWTLNTGVRLFLEGLTFTTFQNTFSLQVSGTYPILKLNACKFQTANHVIQDPASTLSVSELIVTNCVMTGITQAGIRCSASTIGTAVITGNRISSINGTGSAGPKGIMIGQNSDTLSTGHIIISDNVVEQMSATFTDCQGIIVYGQRAIISNNTLDDIQSTSSTDCEGIYTKCAYSIISGNRLLNAGYEEACINVKGVALAGSGAPEGHSVQVVDNVILVTNQTEASIGIGVHREDVLVKGNIIEGTVKGIWVGHTSDSITNVTLVDNEIRRLRLEDGNTTGSNVGIEAESGVTAGQTLTGLTIRGGSIKDVGNNSNNQDAWGIHLKLRNGDAMDNVIIEGVVIENLKSSTGTDERGINGNVTTGQAGDGWMIRDCIFRDLNTAIRLNNSDLLTNVRVLDNMFDGTATAYVFVNDAPIDVGGRVNVRQFGAVGDGSADDDTAVTDALLTAQAVSVPLYFPPGTYLITTGLILGTNDVLYGEGRNLSVIKTASAITMITLANDVELRGLKFDGSNTSGSKGIKDLNPGPIRWLMTDCYINDFDVGLEIEHSIICRVQDTYIRRCSQAGIHALDISGGTINAVYVIGGEIQLNATGVLIEGDTNQFNFYNAVIEGNTNYGVEMASPTANSIITNFYSCWFEANGDHHISCDAGWNNSTVKNCYFDDDSQPIEIWPKGGQKATTITIDQCTFANNANFTNNIELAGGAEDIHVLGCTRGPITGGVLAKPTISDSATRTVIEHFKSGEDATANDTTPAVLGTRVLKVDNTGTITITDFDEGYNNQILQVITDSNTIVAHTSGVIELENNLDFSPSNGGKITLIHDDGVWKELSRKPERRSITLYVVDFDTALETGDGQIYWRIPEDLNNLNLVSVGAQLGAAQSTSGTVDIQIARLRSSTPGGARSAVDIFSTLLTVDANEWDSRNAATPVVINASNDDVEEGDLLRVDVDSIGTGSQGLLISLTFE